MCHFFLFVTLVFIPVVKWKVCFIHYCFLYAKKSGNHKDFRTSLIVTTCFSQRFPGIDKLTAMTVLSEISLYENHFMPSCMGRCQSQKFKLLPLVLVASGPCWSEKSHHCCFQKTAEDDLHSLGKGTVLRSELYRKSNRINTVSTIF